MMKISLFTGWGSAMNEPKENTIAGSIFEENSHLPGLTLADSYNILTRKNIMSDFENK